MRLGSLFSGIGGFELGLEAALGCETTWQVEQDPYARSVLRRWWPNADRSIRWVQRANAERLAPVDIICGGFPCQDISAAGTGGGLHGKRSGLWFEFARVVCELGPAFVAIENSPLLKSRGLDVVVRDLATLGYVGEWQTFSAADVGAPHRRARMWVVGWRPDLAKSLADTLSQRGEQHPHGAFCPRRDAAVNGGAPIPDSHRGRQRGGSSAHDHHRSEPQRNNPDGPGASGAPPFQSVAHGVGNRLEGRDAARSIARTARGWQTEPGLGRVANGVPDLVDRLRCLGNAVVPACAYQVGLRIRQILEAHTTTKDTTP